VKENEGQKEFAQFFVPATCGREPRIEALGQRIGFHSARDAARATEVCAAGIAAGSRWIGSSGHDPLQGETTWKAVIGFRALRWRSSQLYLALQRFPRTQRRRRHPATILEETLNDIRQARKRAAEPAK